MTSAETHDDRYRRLPPRTHGLDAEGVARDQRSRLRAAVVQLVAEQGLIETSVTDLTRLSRVSRLTFYKLYVDKQECFLDAFDDISSRVAEVIPRALAAGGGFGGDRRSSEEAVRTALRAFLSLAAAEPDAVLLLLLGTLGGGPPELERRNEQQLALAHRVQVERAAGLAAAAPDPRDPTVHIILGGIREVTSRRIRQGLAHELPGITEELATWMLSYPVVAPASVLLQATALSTDQVPSMAPTVPSSSSAAQQPPRPERLRSGRHDLSPEFVNSHQRDRVIEALAQTLSERGYAGLTVTEIARRAGVSHRTFYQHFPNKQEAILIAARIGVQHGFEAALPAYLAHPDDWPAALRGAIGALYETMAGEPSQALMGFIDVFGAGPQALKLRASTAEILAQYLDLGARHVGHECPTLFSEACVGGGWELTRRYVTREPLSELPRLVPQILYAVLTPYLGPAHAARAAKP